MKLALIAAIAKNGVVGRDNQMPWYLPEDLKHFKELTLGKPIVMGRLTYESIGKPLPGRTNIVVTRQQKYQPQGVVVANGLDQALELAESAAVSEGVDELMVIGGAQIYAEALVQADTLYITEIQQNIDGDAFFPEVEWGNWREFERWDFKGKSPQSLDYSFVTYRRV